MTSVGYALSAKTEVKGTMIVVGLNWFAVLFCTTMQGLILPCSEPITGSRFTKRMSPLLIIIQKPVGFLVNNFPFLVYFLVNFRIFRKILFHQGFFFFLIQSFFNYYLIVLNLYNDSVLGFNAFQFPDCFRDCNLASLANYSNALIHETTRI